MEQMAPENLSARDYADNDWTTHKIGPDTSTIKHGIIKAVLSKIPRTCPMEEMALRSVTDGFNHARFSLCLLLFELHY
jgi:hypothetical protein